MKIIKNLDLKVLATMLVVSLGIAVFVSWMTGLRFWILAVIVVLAIAINGLIAAIEESNSKDN